MTSTTGVRSIAAHQAAAAATQEGTRERQIADLQVEELLYLVRVQEASQTISTACSRINAILHGVANPDRPYLKWDCCDTHRSLKAEKERLLARAEELGVTLALDALTPIED